MSGTMRGKQSREERDAAEIEKAEAPSDLSYFVDKRYTPAGKLRFVELRVSRYVAGEVATALRNRAAWHEGDGRKMIAERLRRIATEVDER